MIPPLDGHFSAVLKDRDLIGLLIERLVILTVLKLMVSAKHHLGQNQRPARTLQSDLPLFAFASVQDFTCFLGFGSRSASYA